MEPAGPWAAAGLYWAGKLYDELSRRSGLTADRKEAGDIFERIIKRYPKSRYRARAEQELRHIYGANLLKSLPSPPVNKSLPPPSPAPEKYVKKIPDAKPPLEKTSRSSETADSKLNTVSGLRYWSNPNYTRIVIDAEKETTYEHRLLKKDPSINKPQRLYVDLDRSRLADGLQKIIPINDNLLSDARAGQYTMESVRVVVDIKSFKTYKIFFSAKSVSDCC